MKLKLALFQDTELPSVIWPRQFREHDDPDLGDRAVRVSEWLDVDFPALSQSEVHVHLEAHRMQLLRRNRLQREELLRTQISP